MKYTNTDNVIIGSNSSNAINEMHATANNINSNHNNNNINHANILVAGTKQQQEHTTRNIKSPITCANNNNNNSNNNNNNNNNINDNNLTTATNAYCKNNSSAFGAKDSANTTTTTTALFCEQVTTVTNLFEKWNDCERTVVMYALLKRLRYPTLKFLQYSIDNNLQQNMGSHGSNLSTVVVDINANNPNYLQNLINAYKSYQLGDGLDTMSSSTSSSDKDSMPCYGSDFQITTSAQCDERKLYARKEDILHEVLNMLPLLKPGNDEAKVNYLALIPMAVRDTMQQFVSAELVQQIFSYLLIHPAISSEDRRSLNVWLRHLEEHIQAAAAGMTNQSYFLPPTTHLSAEHLASASVSSSISSNGSSAASCTSASNVSVASSSLGGSASSSGSSAGSTSSQCSTTARDWQTIAPPSKHKVQSSSTASLQHDWPSPGSGSSGGGGHGSSGSCSGGSSGIVNPLCDNLNGITLNELASSQNSLGLTIGTGLGTSDGSSLVNGVAAAGAAGGLFGASNNGIISLGNANGSNLLMSNVGDDNDNSFSKNGTEILDFDPSAMMQFESSSGSSYGQSQQSQPFASLLMGSQFFDQFGELNRWSLESKIAGIKTRRSNSLTTQTISSASNSSSNSSVITVNDTCSSSTENLAQFANKPRSFSLSIERAGVAGMTNSGSDTRLDDFKPSYIKFQTHNVGMSGIGLWLKSLRLHKYIELFKNMTYEEMMQISEDFLQSVGVTKGASHKLALCIERLKDRAQVLSKIEQDIRTGQLKSIGCFVEELTNIVLTPMKPIETVVPNSGEDNVALSFLRVLELMSTVLQNDPYSDDESLGIFMWILDRSIHNEAFVTHASQIKELKFKLSKLKMSIAPKLHHIKSSCVAGGSNGSISKPSFRWNGKNRKCDTKNGSNDRINHRKNSHEMLSFPINCLNGSGLQQTHHHRTQQTSYASSMDYNCGSGYNNNNTHHQYKSSSYPSFMSSQQQLKHHHQQPQTHHVQQQMQHMLQQQHNHQQQQQLQQTHYATTQQTTQLPPTPQQQQTQQHRRSLNNLIVVSGGAQQPQKIIFKPGQGVITTTPPTAKVAGPAASDKLQMDPATPRSHQVQRKPSLNSSSGSVNSSLAAAAAAAANICPDQPPKKSMAAVVMVSNNKNNNCNNNNEEQIGMSLATPPKIIINNNNLNSNNNNNNSSNNNNNNNNNILNNNLISQQQLQLLAAAAAAVGNNLTVAAAAAAAGCLCGNNCSNNLDGNGSCSGSSSNCSSNNCNNSLIGNSINNNNNNNNDHHSKQQQCLVVNAQNCSNCCLNVMSTNNAERLTLTQQQQTHPHQHQQPQLIANMNMSMKDNCSNSHSSKYQPTPATTVAATATTNAVTSLSALSALQNDYRSLEQLETLCLQMTEQAIN